MSEITRGVIGMPYDMAMGSELSRRQFHAIARELFAENERLKEDRERIRQQRMDYARKNDALHDRVDQLKAENAGLKTGYEAYEQVNAQLKADIQRLTSVIGGTVIASGAPLQADLAEWLDALRKDAERYRYARKHSCAFRSSMPGHEQVTEGDYDSEMDSAMGKGEQS